MSFAVYYECISDDIFEYPDKNCIIYRKKSMNPPYPMRI